MRDSIYMKPSSNWFYSLYWLRDLFWSTLACRQRMRCYRTGTLYESFYGFLFCCGLAKFLPDAVLLSTPHMLYILYTCAWPSSKLHRMHRIYNTCVIAKYMNCINVSGLPCTQKFIIIRIMTDYDKSVFISSSKELNTTRLCRCAFVSVFICVKHFDQCNIVLCVHTYTRTYCTCLIPCKIRINLHEIHERAYNVLHSTNNNIFRP